MACNVKYFLEVLSRYSGHTCLTSMLSCLPFCPCGQVCRLVCCGHERTSCSAATATARECVLFSVSLAYVLHAVIIGARL